jgi:hypothetical protein
VWDTDVAWWTKTVLLPGEDKVMHTRYKYFALISKRMFDLAVMVRNGSVPQRKTCSHLRFEETSLLLYSLLALIYCSYFQGGIQKGNKWMQQCHYLGLKPVKRFNGTSWSWNILSFVFAEWVVLWEAHNKAVHDTDMSTGAHTKCAQAIRELEILYSHRNHVLHP